MKRARRSIAPQRGFVPLQDPLPAMVNPLPVNVFLVTATASHGLYGSPEFVSRQRTVRITP